MKKQKSTAFLFMSVVVLWSLSAAPGVQAADIGELVNSCSECHQKDGASDDPNMPIIGGNSVAYIISSMTAYKKKERSCPEIEFISSDKLLGTTDMCRISRVLSESDIEKLAQYYAAKRFRRANQDFKMALARKGALIHERDCEKCHSQGGNNPDDDAGILAGQWKPYLKQQFFAFYSEKRKLARKMEPKFNKLDKTEVEALLDYYASEGVILHR